MQSNIDLHRNWDIEIGIQSMLRMWTCKGAAPRLGNPFVVELPFAKGWNWRRMLTLATGISWFLPYLPWGQCWLLEILRFSCVQRLRLCDGNGPLSRKLRFETSGILHDQRPYPVIGGKWVNILIWERYGKIQYTVMTRTLVTGKSWPIRVRWVKEAQTCKMVLAGVFFIGNSTSRNFIRTWLLCQVLITKS